MQRVLIAEDSPTQAEQLRGILEDAGLEVVHAVDAETALAIIERESIDLVISDIVMPGISGYELCTRLKAMPHGKRMPVMLFLDAERADGYHPRTRVRRRQLPDQTI